jgi:hypothetical protein
MITLHGGRRLVAGLAVLGSAACAPPGTSGAAASADAPPGLDRITDADLRRDLFALAGDAMRGREGGTLDEMRASVWLAERAREVGMEPAGDDGTYFQFFPLGRMTQSEESSVVIGTTVLRFGRDFLMTTSTSALAEGELAAVPDGATADSSLAGKVVVVRLVLADAPPAPAGRAGAPRRAAERLLRARALVTQRTNALRATGAAAILFVADAELDPELRNLAGAVNNSPIRGAYRRDTLAATDPGGRGGGGGRGGRGGIAGSAPDAPPAPVLLFPSAALERVRQPGARARVQLTRDHFVYPSVNVVARIPGSDPALRGQYVLYSSHQDHDGIRNPIDGDSIWNGADDNATVSVALLAIGRAIKARPTRRSSLFVWHGAEERGLHGSYWYAATPTVPKDSIAAVLNGDMIGRNHPDSAALLGAQPPHRNSAALAEMALRANSIITRFSIDTLWDRPTHPEGWYFRSDHLPYARAGIPALFFSTLLHADYHTPEDDPEKIDIVKLRRMTQWMYATGWAAGNVTQRPRVDPGFQLER